MKTATVSLDRLRLRDDFEKVLSILEETPAVDKFRQVERKEYQLRLEKVLLNDKIF
jgi:hypothetical protein